MVDKMTSVAEAGGTKNGVILSGARRDVYSKEILYRAQPNLLFAQFASFKQDLSRTAGDVIKFTRYEDLTGGSALSEVENIEADNIEANQVSIEVGEHGKGVGFSEYSLRTSWDDIMARATRLLGQHYGRSVDGLVRDEFNAAGSLQTLYAGGAGSRGALAAGSTFDVQVIKDAAELLATGKAPKLMFGGAESYVCVVNPHQARGLRDDDEWIDAHKYVTPGVNNIYRGEIGMIEGVRFVETTNTTVVGTDGVIKADSKPTGNTDAAPGSVDVHQAYFIGENAVGWAEALPVQMRDNGTIDYGRTRQLAWYSILGGGAIEESHCALIETA